MVPDTLPIYDASVVIRRNQDFYPTLFTNMSKTEKGVIIKGYK